MEEDYIIGIKKKKLDYMQSHLCNSLGQPICVGMKPFFLQYFGYLCNPESLLCSIHCMALQNIYMSMH